MLLGQYTTSQYCFEVHLLSFTQEPFSPVVSVQYAGGYSWATLGHQQVYGISSNQMLLERVNYISQWYLSSVMDKLIAEGFLGQPVGDTVMSTGVEYGYYPILKGAGE